jgi:hypothetical protein
VRGRVFVAGLLVELVGHRFQNQPQPFVKLAFREMAAMFGLVPKLQWSFIHDEQTNLD